MNFQKYRLQLELCQAKKRKATSMYLPCKQAPLNSKMNTIAVSQDRSLRTSSWMTRLMTTSLFSPSLKTLCPLAIRNHTASILTGVPKHKRVYLIDTSVWKECQLAKELKTQRYAGMLMTQLMDLTSTHGKKKENQLIQKISALMMQYSWHQQTEVVRAHATVT